MVAAAGRSVKTWRWRARTSAAVVAATAYKRSCSPRDASFDEPPELPVRGAVVGAIGAGAAGTDGDSGTGGVAGAAGATGGSLGAARRIPDATVTRGGSLRTDPVSRGRVTVPPPLPVAVTRLEVVFGVRTVSSLTERATVAVEADVLEPVVVEPVAGFETGVTVGAASTRSDRTGAAAGVGVGVAVEGGFVSAATGAVGGTDDAASIGVGSAPAMGAATGWTSGAGAGWVTGATGSVTGATGSTGFGASGGSRGGGSREGAVDGSRTRRAGCG